MIEVLTPDTLANTVRMLRSEHPGSVLILEGGSDRKVYQKFVDKRQCQILIACGKEKAVGAIEILDRNGFRGALAIVDADFWRLQGVASSSANLLITDTHDLESMILQSPALEHLLQELGSEEKIAKLRARQGVGPRRAILEAARPIGCLRYISLEGNIRLKFDGLDFGKFLSDRRELSVKIDHLVKAVCDHSQNHQVDRRELLDSVKNELQSGHDPWQLDCGHDMVQILSRALRRCIGSNDAQATKAPLVEMSLRLAYHEAYFRDTKLYARIVAWETKTDYHVLRKIA